jgi:hypothetical protein
MSKRAVLIGCNFTHTDAEKNLQLRGCINDAELFKKVLIQKFGFLEEDIALLVDREQDDTLPTAANIKVWTRCIERRWRSVASHAGHAAESDS